MLTAEAQVRTESPGRYLVQLCRHAQQVHRIRHRRRTHDGADAQTPPEIRADEVHAEWSDTYGVVTLPWGQCTMRVTPTTLTLRAEAAEENNLRRVQEIVGRNIERFDRRDQLKVNWRRREAPTAESGGADLADDQRSQEGAEGAVARRGHRRTTVLSSVGALGVILTVAVHLGLGGAVSAASRWLGWTAVGLVIVPVVVVLGHAVVPVTVIGLRRLATRRSKTATAPDEPTSAPKGR